MSTLSFYAADLDAARSWYTDVFGVEPYFQVPGYIEFRIGDYQHEFGIIDAKYATHPVGTPAGAVTFWAVDDLQADLDRLISLGAKEHDPITVRGDGFVTATVIDPFGNILGIMTNTHYFEILDSLKKS